jgi:hypothetical protein
MAKKKITSGMLGGRKKNSLQDIEKAVSKIHEAKTEKPEPVSRPQPQPKSQSEQKPKVQKQKREIKKKELVRLSLDIPKSYHAKFKILAIQKGSSMKELILEFIESEIGK